MGALFLLIIFLLLGTAVPVVEAAAPVIFGDAIEVAAGRGERGPWQQNDSRYDYVDDPTVTLDDRGYITVAWVDQGRKDVFVQRFSPAGKKRLGRPVNVSRSGTTFSWLPRMVLAPNDPRKLFILWQEIIFSGGSHGGDILFARSKDGGKSFSRPVNLSRSTGGDGKGRINREIWHNGSLDLAVGADGALYAAWTEYAGELWFSRSTDGGKSFTRPRRVAGSDSGPARAPCLVTGPGGTLYLAWTTGEDNAADIHLARSSDGGATFDEPRIVAKSAGYSDAPKLAVDGGGVVHLAYAESAGGPFEAYHIRYTRSADGGRTFEPPLDLSGSGTLQGRSAAFPSMGVDRKGRLYVVWELFPDHRKAPRGLELTVSLDGGRAFSPPVVVTGSIDAGGDNGSHQGLLMKKLAVNVRGSVAVVNSSLVQNERSRVWVMPGRLAQ